ncbi:hypothetical protein V1264_003836 [Littorina saxatilis]|uniref:Tick transposon n=1 Tax=Littorina saxatilis TaxID=31220 RepID=A0AAN9B0S0_9CAEN
MIVHPAKTKTMVITSRQKHQLAPLDLKLSLGSLPIEQVREHRVLGVTIDSELNWKCHLNNMNKTLSRNMFLFSQLRYYVDTSVLKLFYHAHILSHLSYASTLWDNCSDVHMMKLNSLHRRAAKLMVPNSSVTTDKKLKLLDLLPLNQQLKLNKALFMFRVTNKEVPEYIQSLFQRATNRYGSSKFIPPRPRLDLYKSSLAFSGSSVWNSLPTVLKHIPSVKAFKKQTHRHLFEV